MPHWLKADFEQLINAFGFYSHQAPGEAEAELVYLNHIGVIDAVLTNDVDAFVFGAETVIQTCAERASTNPQVRLLREDLFLIAILAGGDYDQVSWILLTLAPPLNKLNPQSGLIGCGVTLAQQISQSGLGHDLFMEMHRSADPMDVDQFLQHWCVQLQHELSVDPNKTLGRRYQWLADLIQQDFPPWEVMDKYIHPFTSEQTAGIHWRPTGWVPQCLSLEKVTQLCKELFSWGTVPGIMNHLATHVWIGACMCTLLQACGWISPMSTLLIVHVTATKHIDRNGGAPQQ
ncbi:hypothetical protein APHAL10511_000625 [Amanita phalloides]|nr:hypothetical protein APHAL10511_000625 [Amanita phalloides]